MSRTIAVVGGGYGGAAVAKSLESEADVVHRLQLRQPGQARLRLDQ